MKLRFNGVADAYLEWAVQVGFTGFVDAMPKSPDSHEIAFIAKRREADACDGLKFWSSADIYADQLYVTGTLPASWLLEPAHTSDLVQCFTQLELASALGDYPPKALDKPGEGREGRLQPHALLPKKGLVLACIDDAFPIASARFMDGNGRSRVIRLWDQEREEAQTPASGWFPVGQGETGLPKTNFAYGAELLSPAPLDRVPLGGRSAVADSAYYERMGMRRMRHHATHGALVLDALAGPISVEDRLGGKSRTSSTRDIASKAPLILVQLPDAARNDPSGRWLARHVLDGLRYIVAAAGPGKTVAVNVSWGPQTGPHDGSSLLEQAMDALVAEYAKTHGSLHIVLPAGNSFQQRAHAQFLASEGTHQDLVWCVPPDRRTTSFLEIWWPNEKSDVNFTVTAPDLATIKVKQAGIYTAPGPAVPDWGLTVVRRNGRTMALVAVSPGNSGQGGALHGQWKIAVKPQLDASNTGSLVHVYVARSDPNMGGRRASAGSYLLDAAYENMRRQRNGEVADDPTDSQVKREGTLSGIATGARPWVVGGLRGIHPVDCAPYTSSGPAAAGPRVGPDYASLCDASKGLPGVLAGAVRAGSVLRMQGTSMAAPQLARRLANEPTLCRVPTDGTGSANPNPPAKPGPPHLRMGYGKPRATSA